MSVQGLPNPLPAWIPEPFRTEYSRTGDAFVAGLAGAFIYWASEESPFRYLLDEDAVRDLLLLPGVSTTYLGPV